MLPFLLPYAGVTPRFASAPAHAGPGSAVLGRAEIGRGAWLGAGSVIRADGHYVAIGDGFRLGPRATVHIAHDVYPTHVGSGVTAGPNSVIHACDVGDRCYVGANAVILDGSKLAAGIAIADDAIVLPRSELEGGWLYAGAPARPVRRLEPEELDALHAASREEPDAAGLPLGGVAGQSDLLFLAATARIAGIIEAGGANGVWFGCDLDAGTHAIRIGENTNVQDNTVIRCLAGPVVIGRNSTIGHNVAMTDCSVGDDSLIGIGARVAPDTVVGDDVLLAAGAHTVEGQVLASGWLYGGRPAAKLKPLDEPLRAIIARIWPHYCDYARAFAAAQAESAPAAP